MIIISPGITRYFASHSILGMLMRCVVVERDDDDGTNAGKEFTGIRALVRVAGHPLHLAVVATGQPFK